MLLVADLIFSLLMRYAEPIALLAANVRVFLRTGRLRRGENNTICLSATLERSSAIPVSK